MALICKAYDYTTHHAMTQSSPHPFLPVHERSGCRDMAFISKGYDATTHFETTVEDVLDMYRRITGKDLDLSAKDPATVEAS